MGGAITGDGEGADEEKVGDRHPPHMRSPPTFQPCLRLRCKSVPMAVHSAASLLILLMS